MPEISSNQANTLSVAILSPLETLAQSIAGIAPSATPGILIPIVYGFAGNGTWFSYLLGTIGIVFAAQCINEFTSREVCPGSLYTFVSGEYGKRAGVLTGWSLLFAYILCGSACVTQFALFAMSLTEHLLNWRISHQLTMIVSSVLVGFCAYKNIKLSAKLMLWLEFFSIAMILLVILLTLGKLHFPVDRQQFDLTTVNFENIRAGVVMAIFSFVGFESAASLGTEAKEPLKSVPRAIMRSVIISGLFFVFSSYVMVAAFSRTGAALNKCATPLLVMCDAIGIPYLGHVIDAGIMMSFFAASCAVLNAAARLVYKMSGDGFFHHKLSHTHEQNRTPHFAVLLCIAVSLSVALVLTLFNFPLLDIVGWFATLATFGFIYAYLAASFAAAHFLRRKNCLTGAKGAVVATSVLVLAFSIVGSLYPAPAPPYNILPFVFVAYMVLGFLKVRG